MIASISMVKDEADVIEGVLRRMAHEVDAMFVADNGSTDGTRDLLATLARELPLTVLDDPDPAYYQSDKMTRLAAVAAKKGATWVIPVDADEVWYSPFGRIADVLARLGSAVATAFLYDHVATGADAAGSPTERMQWRRIIPAPLAKVACRVSVPVVIEQGNHGAHYDTGTIEGQLIVRHFPYRSAEQFVRKVRNGAAAYAATTLPAWEGAHWRQYGAILAERGPEVLADEVFRRWFWVLDPAADPSLIRDPCPGPGPTP